MIQFSRYRIIKILTFVLGTFLITSCPFDTEGPLLGSSGFSVGSTGPAGGYIFFDRGHYSDGWRYLEAAPVGWYEGTSDSFGPYPMEGYEDEDPYFQWGIYGSAITPSSTAKEIGSGSVNTSNIVSYHDDVGDYYDDPRKYDQRSDGTVAAKVCDDYSRTYKGVTYSDWFLPSIDELYQMQQNLHQKGYGGFSSEVYWSSSEYDGNKARVMDFSFVKLGLYDSRHMPVKVRPVRAF